MRDGSDESVSHAYDGQRSYTASLSTYITNMTERVRKLFQRSPSYEPLLEDEDGRGGHDVPHGSVFSWVDYLIFTLMGVSMLWAW